MLGQTSTLQVVVLRQAVASMEGRAIARPNRSAESAAGQLVIIASMEGRAIARPNETNYGGQQGMALLLQWRAEQLLGQTWLSGQFRSSSAFTSLQWRAEQLLGQTELHVFSAGRTMSRRKALQWRAEQLLGQTCGRHLVRPDDWRLLASMEGRAIARPNLRRPWIR